MQTNQIVTLISFLILVLIELSVLNRLGILNYKRVLSTIYCAPVLAFNAIMIFLFREKIQKLNYKVINVMSFTLSTLMWIYEIKIFNQ